MFDTPSRVCRGIGALGLTAALGAAALASPAAHAQGYRDYDRFDRGYDRFGERGYEEPGDRPGYYGRGYGPRYGGYYPAPYYGQPAYVVAPSAIYLPPRAIMAPRIAYATRASHRPVHAVAHHVAAKPIACAVPGSATTVSLPPISPSIRLAPSLMTVPPASNPAASKPPVFLEPGPPVGD